MLNSVKKKSRCARQKINILALVLPEKNILNETKNHNPPPPPPPPPFKLNGRSLSDPLYHGKKQHRNMTK